MDWVFGTFQKMAYGYEPDRVAPLAEVNGLKVSTVAIDDMPGYDYETAILDANGTHPVARYITEDDAKAGHARWLDMASTLATVTKLGTEDGLVDDEEITLERFPEGEG